MNKKTLIKKIVAHLVGELELYAKAANAARFEATHEQSKAENKYDTRGLEASYLARGQSKQAAEIAQAIEEFQQMEPKKFSATDPIDVGAVVQLDGGGEESFYFIGPRAGGTEVQHEKKEILVITPQSPLGQQIVGKKQGDVLQIQLAGAKSQWRVVAVW